MRNDFLKGAGGKEGLECAGEGDRLTGAEVDLEDCGWEGRFRVCGGR